VILVLPADISPDTSNQYQALVYGLASKYGMRFQLRNTLTPQDVEVELPWLKIVIALAPDKGLAALAAAEPEVQFLAVGISGLHASSNLSILGADDPPVDRQAFLAGYMAAMLAPEWRVGILTQKDTPQGTIASEAFTNGFHFYCGYCLNPNFTQPYAAGMYPAIVRIPTDLQPGQDVAYANALPENFYTKMVYVYPGVETSDVVGALLQANVLVISQALPAGLDKTDWVASIQPDLLTPIETLFPQLLDGKGGQLIPTPLVLSDINTDQLTTGKQALVQEILDGLQDGSISANTLP
jgi:hypothetical protein